MENKTNTNVTTVTVEITRLAPYAKLNLPKDQIRLIKSEIAKRLERANVSASEITDPTAKAVLEHFGITDTTASEIAVEEKAKAEIIAKEVEERRARYEEEKAQERAERKAQKERYAKAIEEEKAYYAKIYGRCVSK